MDEIYVDLEEEIVRSFTNGVSLEEAERLAGRFLHAQMLISNDLKTADLDSRMRKSGLKAVKAAVYIDTCSKADKKPTEAMIDHTINQTPIVNQEQEALDTAEVEKANLERYYDIFGQAHVYFRQMSRGVQG